jgi:hypothetical protein
MKTTIATSLLALHAASVLAAPAIESNSALVARQNLKLYENPDGGWVVVEYGDGRLNYGERLPSSILDIINEQCGEASCNPSGGYGFTALVVDGSRAGDRSYTVSVQGAFNPNGLRGTKAQLLELAKMAFQEVYNVGVATFRPDVFYVTNECPPNQVNGCPGKFPCEDLAQELVICFPLPSLTQTRRSRNRLRRAVGERRSRLCPYQR